jgi:uncharacterized LabA/DUF88 family protein
LVRTYWFRPQKNQDTAFNDRGIRYTVIKSDFNGCLQNHKDGNEDRIDPETLRKIDERCKTVKDWLTKQQKRFSDIEYSYDQLCLDNNDLEIIKTGIVKVNPYRELYIGEKGVDIALAVKMLALSFEKKCDKIILMSGDYDYAEAIKYVKNNMTKIHIVKIHKGYPPQNRNMSRDLSVMADKILDVYEASIRSNFIRNIAI